MSINLDKCLSIDLPVYSDPTDPRVDLWCKHWSSRPGFDKLDSMCMTEVEANQLLETLETMKKESITFFQQPALKEFELRVSASIDGNGMTVVRYKKTILPKTPVILPCKDGSHMEVTPYIDAFISLRNTTEVDTVVVIFTTRLVDSEGIEFFSGTFNKELWRNYNLTLNKLINDDVDGYVEVQRAVKLLYIGIQKAMYEKPVVFTETSRRSTIQSKRSTGKHRSHRKVKIVKTICINRKEFDDYTGPHKHMTCPCWGVIGHWRTYKTGKKVWIEPYRKGKERKTPSAYSPKEYALKEEKKV